MLFSSVLPSGGWGLEAADTAAAAADSRGAHAGLHPDFSCQGSAPGLQNSSGISWPGYIQHMPGERAAGHPYPSTVSAVINISNLFFSCILDSWSYSCI